MAPPSAQFFLLVRRVWGKKKLSTLQESQAEMSEEKGCRGAPTLSAAVGQVCRLGTPLDIARYCGAKPACSKVDGC